MTCMLLYRNAPDHQHQHQYQHLDFTGRRAQILPVDRLDSNGWQLSRGPKCQSPYRYSASGLVLEMATGGWSTHSCMPVLVLVGGHFSNFHPTAPPLGFFSIAALRTNYGRATSELAMAAACSCSANAGHVMEWRTEHAVLLWHQHQL